MSSQQPPGHDRTLTYGIEFEFMVAVQVAGGPDPHPNDTRYANFASLSTVPAKEQVQNYVVALLKNNGIPALSDIQLDDVDSEDEDSDVGKIEYVRKEAIVQGVTVDRGHVATHAFWMVLEDVGITPIDGEDIDGYKFVAVEVASRVLQATDFREVERVYSLVKSNLRTQVNTSCGLHVHVGIGHLSVESVKKLVTLLMVLEEKGLFKAICAPHRASSTWCQPISQRSRAVMCEGDPSRDLASSRLDLHVPQVNSGMHDSLHAGLTHVWNCQTIDEIAAETKVHRGGAPGYTDDSTWNRRGGFAIRNTKMGPGIRGGLVAADDTVEFRYKESTGSADQDRHWLQLCLGFVRAAEWQVGQFQRVMWAIHQARDLEGCLASLGVEEGGLRWWSGIVRHHLDNPMQRKRTEFLGPE